MKVNFCCNVCSESFNVSDKNLITKQSVICPNCSTKFPEDSFVELREGVEKISSCRKNLPLQDVNYNYSAVIDFKIID